MSQVVNLKADMPLKSRRTFRFFYKGQTHKSLLKHNGQNENKLNDFFISCIHATFVRKDVVHKSF